MDVCVTRALWRCAQVVHLYLLSQRQQAALLAASLSGGGGASSGINGEAEACAVCPAVECPSVELIECPVVERAECPEFEPVQPAEWKQPECPTFPPQDASGQASFDGWVLPRLFRGDDPIVYTSAPYDLKEVPFVVFAWSTGHFWEVNCVFAVNCHETHPCGGTKEACSGLQCPCEG